MNPFETDKPFLGVRNSALGQEWRDRLDARARNTALAIAQTTEIPELVARVLAGRGVEAESAARFLDPSIRDLMPDPSVMTDMDKAAARLAEAIKRRERVAIFGDYDVDGAASSALLYRFLVHHGIEAEIRIPDRIFEGYGPNPVALRELVAHGASLIVTVDCGSNSFEALEAARDAGADVVVIDHHLTGVELPPATAVVNPNRQDDLSGLGYLCAAGVTFMTLVATARSLRAGRWYGAVREPDLMRELDLVALATVCDVVPLTGLNRAFVVKGLQAMRARANVGLAALASVARLSGPPEPYHLGFILGPRINAGGRIGDAGLGARLLVCEDTHEADAIAMKLEDLNRERQAQEAAMLQQALAQAEAEIGSGEGPCVLITESANWHPGIVGLIAARLKERFRRPAFAIHFNEAGRGTGSGRSVSGIDIGRAVREAVEKGILVKGGGHVMAAGLTVERANLAALRAYFEETLASSWRTLTENHVLKIDGALTARGANLALVELLERAGPFGSGHPSPIFAFPAHTVRDARIVGTDHVSVRLSAGDGAMLQGIAFRAAGTELGKLLLGAPQPLHVAGTLGAELFRGQRRIQLRILDAAPPPAFV
ncbi:MAG TPA: single-stranded-DNA-specific exonuclease RecJ [Rhizobiaceae bacterium]|nr:single-stranded-DNA-specific exonuclease RecJ [Rhizobiaceae bacterium]